MADGTGIEWCDATWNPVRGCTRVSPGCGGANHEGGCYAEKIAARFSDPGQPFHGFAERTKHGGRWTGKMALVEHALDLPLRWKRPRRIFVNSMSDLFHENLPDEAIDEVMAVIGACEDQGRGHIFLILTKRAERARDYMRSARAYDSWNRRRLAGEAWPPRNIGLGVSVEDQPRADERIPLLLDTPAAVRFISAEPLLGPVQLRGNIDRSVYQHDIDWVIVGGESGPNARPMHPAWPRSLRDQCQAAGAAFFFKQWGQWAPDFEGAATCSGCDGLKNENVTRNNECSQCGVVEWIPSDKPLNSLIRVGKKAAGRLLDGREWSEFPEPHNIAQERG